MAVPALRSNNKVVGSFLALQQHEAGTEMTFFIICSFKSCKTKMSGGKNLPHLQVDLNHSHPGPDHVLEG